MMMQGYDAAAAVPFIAKAMRKAGHKEPQEELEKERAIYSSWKKQNRRLRAKSKI